MERSKFRCATRLCARAPSFIIYINDVFLLMKGTELCNVADEMKNVFNRLEHYANQSTPWFSENYKKLIEEKLNHLIIFGANKENVDIHIGNMKIEEIDEEKLLGIILAKKLSFKKHFQTLSKKLTKSSMLLLVFPFTWSPRS